MHPENQHIDANNIKRLIAKGKTILNSKKITRGLSEDYYIVNSEEFNSWKSQVLNFIRTCLGEKSDYYRGLSGGLQPGAYPISVQNGIKHLEAILQDISHGVFTTFLGEPDPLLFIKSLLHKFPRIARQLRKRHGNRSTLDISDEYDVQDLLHCLLMIEIDDIRPEEWNPSYAGNSSRVDFFLPDSQIVIEVKKTRNNLRNKEVANELIIDMERYRKSSHCKHLICFVYDPDGYISNPAGFEKDLSGSKNGLNIVVNVRPH